MEPNTAAIVALCWSRLLGLDDQALQPDAAGSPRARIERQTDTGAVSLLRLFGHEVLAGPQWALDAARPYDREALHPHRLLTLCRQHGPRLLGEAAVGYTDRYQDLSTSVPVTDDPQAVRDLIARCPADDAAEAGIEDFVQQWVVLDAADLPVALAGFSVWGGVIAQLGVLTARADRGRGHGRLAACVAINEALDAGLVPQWRARIDNRASLALGTALHVERVGAQITVLLDQ